MQELWRLCCNEVLCIMHELAFERHAAPNVVIFCLPSLTRSSLAVLLYPLVYLNQVVAALSAVSQFN